VDVEKTCVDLPETKNDKVSYNTERDIDYLWTHLYQKPMMGATKKGWYYRKCQQKRAKSAMIIGFGVTQVWGPKRASAGRFCGAYQLPRRRAGRRTPVTRHLYGGLKRRRCSAFK